MAEDSCRDGLDFVLYFVALNLPEVLREAVNLNGVGMVANNQEAMRRAREARELFTADAERMRAALRKAGDENDYCFVCDMHPSSGHAPKCPVA